jgi:hypothetical protein
VQAYANAVRKAIIVAVCNDSPLYHQIKQKQKL